MRHCSELVESAYKGISTLCNSSFLNTTGDDSTLCRLCNSDEDGLSLLESGGGSCWKEFRCGYNSGIVCVAKIAHSSSRQHDGGAHGEPTSSSQPVGEMLDQVDAGEAPGESHVVNMGSVTFLNLILIFLGLPVPIVSDGVVMQE